MFNILFVCELSSFCCHASRIDRASGPYQMISVLVDAIVFRCDQADNNVSAEYLEEIPVDYFNEKYSS